MSADTGAATAVPGNVPVAAAPEPYTVTAAGGPEVARGVARMTFSASTSRQATVGFQQPPNGRSKTGDRVDGRTAAENVAEKLPVAEEVNDLVGATAGLPGTPKKDTADAVMPATPKSSVK